MDETDGKSKFYTFKVLVVGEPNTGKTAFVTRYVYDTFNLERISTKGVEYAQCVFDWDANTKVRLNFWDVAGQERVGTQSSVYFRNAHAALVLYDVMDRVSFESVPLWKHLINENVRRNGEPDDIPTILLANKIDLVVERSEDFDPTDLNNMTNNLEFSCGIPISNLDNYNIAQTIKKLVELLLIRQKQLEEEMANLDYDVDTVILLDGNLPQRSKCC
jgi:small GTP-binding protein